jgi:hypothetical protein
VALRKGMDVMDYKPQQPKRDEESPISGDF